MSGVSGSDLPEPDAVPGAPHPRMTRRLFGHEGAEAAFLSAHVSGRQHHAWLISGPRGIGKATLAWRIARFLLTRETGTAPGLFGAAAPPESLDPPPGHPVLARVEALSEGRLLLIRRSYEERSNPPRLRSVITVDDVRRLRDFFALSAPDGGARVVIIDAADEMNTAAANALLKVLEEPPPAATLLLISHQPARLLPTIRSRCRSLKLAPLAPAELEEALRATGFEAGSETGALWALSAGSVGEALRLLSGDGPALYARLVALLTRAPGIDRPGVIALADLAARRDEPGRLEMLVGLIAMFLARLVRSGAGHPPDTEAAPGERALLERLAPDSAAARLWAELAQVLSGRAGHSMAVNLDPAAVILDMLLRIDAQAARLPVARPMT